MKYRRPKVLSRNHSCNGLRRTLDRTPYRVIVRLGSVTERDADLHINTVQAVKNSSSKFIMKTLFENHNVNQALWYKDLTNVEFPLVAKKHYGRQGIGMVLIKDEKELEEFVSSNNIDRYVIEKFYNYSREYRVHISDLGEIMSWRKLRRSNSTERWFFNSHNCNWVSSNHELFNKPDNWEDIIEHCSRALKATGLNLGACDVRVNKKGDFIICEINSAPALGELGIEQYRDHLNKLIQWKIQDASQDL
jgi:glutathione synthase/RimK-type ligase-like ATP-grasp enzyme